LQAGNEPIHATFEVEDSDDWLKIDAGDLDTMLENTIGVARRTKPRPEADPMKNSPESGEETIESRINNDHAQKLQKLASKVEEFVDAEGDLEGALFEELVVFFVHSFAAYSNGCCSDEFSEEEFSENDSDDDDENHEMDQNSRQTAMDRLVPGLEPSDYGKMPASFHSNSQRVAPVVMEPVKEEAGKDKETRPMRRPILPRDDFDGVDSDDETDEDDEGDNDESDEDRPQVVSDIEIDMGEEEDEFLEFSRQALGITDEQWSDILRDRQSRGGKPTCFTLHKII
jgi:hypothetical protein